MYIVSQTFEFSTIRRINLTKVYILLTFLLLLSLVLNYNVEIHSDIVLIHVNMPLPVVTVHGTSVSRSNVISTSALSKHWRALSDRGRSQEGRTMRPCDAYRRARDSTHDRALSSTNVANNHKRYKCSRKQKPGLIVCPITADF